MADSKWIEQKEEYVESKTKICEPQKTNTDVEKHFKNPLGNDPRVTNKPIQKFISYQPDTNSDSLPRKSLI